MTATFKKIATLPLLAVMGLSLTGCIEEGFDGLPYANTRLSNASPEGVWMLLNTENASLPNSADSMNPFNYSGQSREVVVITANDQGIYEMTRCDSDWRKPFTLTATSDGYEATLTETSNAGSDGVVYSTLTDLTVAYSSDNRSLTAEGSRVTMPYGEAATFTIEGVKISDATSLAEASELTYSYNFDYTHLGNAGTEADTIAQCIAVAHGVKTTEDTADQWELDQKQFIFFDQQSRQTQYYEFNQNIDGVLTHSLGAVINGEAVVTMYINSCQSTDAACNAAASWSESSYNSMAGVSFDINYGVVDNQYVINPIALTPWTAFLWPHDGDYMHTAVSISINSYDNFR